MPGERPLLIIKESEVIMFQIFLPVRTRNGLIGSLYRALFVSSGWADFPGDLELRELREFDDVRQKWYDADEYQERKIRDEMLKISPEMLFQCQFSQPKQSMDYFRGIMSQWVNSHLELIDVAGDEKVLKRYQGVLRNAFAKAVEKVMPNIPASPLVPVVDNTNDDDEVSESVFGTISRSASSELYFD